MPARPRPLSPHLQIYRWQIGNTLSILHRFTGIALALGTIGFCGWLVSIAAGPGRYGAVHRALASPAGVLILIGLSFAFLYHLFNGLRHLFWDAGWGFERRARHLSGWFAVLGACVSTLALWTLLWIEGRL